MSSPYRIPPQALLLVAALVTPVTAACSSSPRPANQPGEAHRDPLRFRKPAWFVHAARRAALAGDVSRAEQYFALALKQGAAPARVLPELLRVCIEGSRLRAALNYAEPQLRATPDDLDLRYLVATLLVGLGRPEAARVELERVLRISEGHPEAHYLIGILEMDVFLDVAAARAHFARYRALAPRGLHEADVAHRLLELQAKDDLRTQLSSAAHGEPAR